MTTGPGDPSEGHGQPADQPPGYAQPQSPPGYAQPQSPPGYAQPQSPPGYAQPQSPPGYQQQPQYPPGYQQPPVPPGYGQPQHQPPGPVAGQPYAGGAPAAGGRNVLAIIGFILAFILAPVGFIISLVALIQATKRRQKGKVLAVLGMLVALGEGAALVALIVLVVHAVPNVRLFLDPGCVEGKTVLAVNSSIGDTSDTSLVEAKLQATVSGLDDAAANAHHSDVRAAMKALSADVEQLSTRVQAGNLSSTSAEAMVVADSSRVYALCTIA